MAQYNKSYDDDLSKMKKTYNHQKKKYVSIKPGDGYISKDVQAYYKDLQHMSSKEQECKMLLKVLDVI